MIVWEEKHKKAWHDVHILHMRTGLEKLKNISSTLRNKKLQNNGEEKETGRRIEQKGNN